MRLILTGPWGQLEPETTAEAEALEQSAARGDWTIGRGPAAIEALGTLASRLGYPVRVTEARETPTGPPLRLVVVQRGEMALAERLRTIAQPAVPVIWDRRQRDRRASDRPVSVDHRQRDRRGPPPATWGTLRFLVVRPTEPPA